MVVKFDGLSDLTYDQFNLSKVDFRLMFDTWHNFDVLHANFVESLRNARDVDRMEHNLFGLNAYTERGTLLCRTRNTTTHADRLIIDLLTSPFYDAGGYLLPWACPRRWSCVHCIIDHRCCHLLTKCLSICVHCVCEQFKGISQPRHWWDGLWLGPE